MRALERPSPAAVCKGRINILWVRTSDLEWSLGQFVSCTLLVMWAYCCPVASPMGKPLQRVTPRHAIHRSHFMGNTADKLVQVAPQIPGPMRQSCPVDRCLSCLGPGAVQGRVLLQQIRDAVINPSRTDVHSHCDTHVVVSFRILFADATISECLTRQS